MARYTCVYRESQIFLKKVSVHIHSRVISIQSRHCHPRMINLVLFYLRTVTISVVYIHTALCYVPDEEDHWSKRCVQLLLIDVYIARITKFSTKQS